MAIMLYNTYSKAKEEFKPVAPGRVTMYNCGPTVYSHPHIGNFRSFLFADTLRRWLEYKGFEVRQVMNITDVGHLLEDADEGEDKLEAAAKKEQKDPWQIAKMYTDEFMEVKSLLNMLEAMKYPRATDHVPEMIAIVQKLIEKGFAYEVNKAVYFDVSKFPNYGKLSGNTLEQLQEGARIEVHPDKHDPMDFALWKHDPKHLMQWDSPWGKGFPGWHIECSAMSTKYLGETVDIHTGGEDNIFPHHECEIAQTEAATGKRFVNYWLHARFLLVNGEKMSKSKGNFFTIKDIIDKGFDPRALRYALVSTHYRQPLNFTLDGLAAAQTAVQRLMDFRDRMAEASAMTSDSLSPEIEKLCSDSTARFDKALEDDVNTSEALGAVFDFTREANRIAPKGLSAKAVLDRFDKFNSVFGLKPQSKGLLDSEVEQLIKDRVEARKSKNFARADAIRDELKDKGIALEDTPQGMRWKRN